MTACETGISALFAARRATICMTVTLRSWLSGDGAYRQPPLGDWVFSISATAAPDAGFQLRVRVHAVQFGQGEGRQPVLVHRPAAELGEVALRVVLGVGQDELLARLKDVRIAAPARGVPAAEEREHGERVVGVVGVPAAVLALLRGEVFEAPVDGGVDASVDGLRLGRRRHRASGFGLGEADRHADQAAHEQRSAVATSDAKHVELANLTAYPYAPVQL